MASMADVSVPTNAHLAYNALVDGVLPLVGDDGRLFYRKIDDVEAQAIANDTTAHLMPVVRTNLRKLRRKVRV